MIKSRRISWLTSMLNLYLLYNAVRALQKFTPLGIDDYAITELASAEECLRSLKLEEAAVHTPAGHALTNTSEPHSLFERVTGKLAKELRDVTETFTHEVAANVKKARFADDLASIMRTCRSQLAATEPPGLTDAKAFYWMVSYCLIGAALCFDVCRWCGCGCFINDLILGFRSTRWERFRLLPQLIMLVPFAHLTWLLSRPLTLPCCEGTPKPANVLDRVRVLAWLCTIVTYCLFADAHNHGFFLLRSPAASACRLLRPCLHRNVDRASGYSSPTSGAGEGWAKV